MCEHQYGYQCILASHSLHESKCGYEAPIDRQVLRLAKAIDRATDELEVLKTDVPIPWLKCFDVFLPAASGGGAGGKQLLSLQEVALRVGPYYEQYCAAP